MTARISLIPGRTRGHRPRLQSLAQEFCNILCYGGECLVPEKYSWQHVLQPAFVEFSTNDTAKCGSAIAISQESFRGACMKTHLLTALLVVVCTTSAWAQSTTVYLPQI